MKEKHGWKRWIALALTAALAAGMLSACGKTDAPQTTEPAEQTMIEPISVAESTDAQTQVALEEETAEAQTEEATAEAAEQTTSVDEEEPAAEETETTEAARKAPQTKEEIVALYNESANAVKTGAKAVVTNYVLNTQTSDAALSNKMLQNIANKLISANMGYDQKQANVTYSGASAIRDHFPVRGQNWSSQLTASDVAKATCTEKDGIYTVTLYLQPDTTPNIKAGQGHAGKAFSIITKDQIVDGAGSLGMSVIQEDTIKLTFKDSRIIAKIDAQTGQLKDVNYYIDWTLSLTALGIDVSVSFGAEDDFTIKW